MSFRPGLPVQMTRQVYATTSVPSGAMMVQMASVRPVTMVPVSQMMVRPVIRPVISQSQAFIPAIHHQAVAHVVTNQPQIIQTANQQVWIQAEPRKATFISQPQEIQKEINNTTANQSSAETANEPAVTVFVGNITDRASDTLVRQILMKCGSVYAWKRVQGPSGKLQAFGFCEYKDPESALRAIHVLHDFLLGDKKLLVKVDAKTQERIDDWKKEKELQTDENGKIKLAGVEEAVGGIEALVQGYSSELASSEKEDALQVLKPDPTVRESTNVEDNLNGLQLEEDEKNFISKEIRFFRESQKQHDEKLKWLKEERTRNREDYFRSRARIERDERERRSRPSLSRRSWSRSPRRRSPTKSLLIRRRSSRSITRSPSRRRSRSSSRRRSRSRTPRRRTRSPSSRRRSRTRSPSRRRTRSRSRRRSRSRSRSSRRRSVGYSSRRRSHSRSRSSRRRSRSYSSRRRSKSRSRSRYRSRSRSYSRRRRSYSRSPSSSWSSEDDSDREEKRRMFEERIQRKQDSYQKRLKAVEALEKRIQLDHVTREQERASERRAMTLEAKRLREFLADYDDDKQDTMYYVGESLTDRLKKREEEIKMEELDRKKEKEEIELLRERLVMENHPDPDGLIDEVIAASNDIWKPLLTTSIDSPSSDVERYSSSFSDVDLSDLDLKSSGFSSEVGSNVSDKTDSSNRLVSSLKQSTSKSIDHSLEMKSTSNIKTKFKPISSAQSSNHSSQELVNTAKRQSSSENSRPIKLSSRKNKIQVSHVFNQDKDDDDRPQRKKLIPLQSDERKTSKSSIKQKKSNDENKRRLVRALIEKIPTTKDDLFDFKIDWSMLDTTLMEKRIRPWINKKIVEYVGEEEPTLVEFICSKITSKTAPLRILEDISMVLDDEADVFVVKLWRLLIYETEAKKEGLTKLV